MGGGEGGQDWEIYMAGYFSNAADQQELQLPLLLGRQLALALSKASPLLVSAPPQLPRVFPKSHCTFDTLR